MQNVIKNVKFNQNMISNDEQVIELKVQDVILSGDCAKYFIRVANFIDYLSSFALKFFYRNFFNPN